jgi:hypothetical protein
MRFGASNIIRLFSEVTMSLSPILTPSLDRTLSGMVTWYFRVTLTSSCNSDSHYDVVLK